MSDVETLLEEIAAIGATEHGGVRRLAWTEEDARLAQWFAGACAERGLEVGTDRCGNQWAWWGDPDAELPAEDGDGEGEDGLSADGTLPRGGVVTGSHLDSVPDGGGYDGPLGVATALAAVDELKARDFTPRRAIGVVRFVDEEGARFGVPCAGSRLLTGQAEPADVLARLDDDGISYAEAAAKAGLDVHAIGRDDAALNRVGAFVEVHVEQGFTLAAEEVDSPLGVCGLIRPHGRWRVEIHGRGDHAGTARFADRSDPMLELARLITTVRFVASRQDALATVGRVEVHPNVTNAVPAVVVAWVDIRADTTGQVKSVASEIKASGFDLEQESWTPPTPLGGPLTDRITHVAGDAVGIGPLPVLATGAGHDAGVLATAGVPAAMIFVRNPSGISHAPEEAVRPADTALGVRSLAAVLADLCG
ncbi:MAG TPA: allantoate amidohydrolase [Kineosporiaceae bacterium]|nr:allantoate amidohydrolase [Kineosporiaceae bacterium]